MVKITLKSKQHISNRKKNKKKFHPRKIRSTLMYSQRKPERGIAISCNGHCITLLIKALILGG